MSKSLSCFALIFTLICSFTAHSQVLPSKVWRTVTVGEFELVFDSQHQAIAEVYAQRLSKLTSALSPYWKNIPRKTVVVLNDRTDATNGYATFLPYPHIVIYPVLPGPMESIGEFNDWAWELLVHEYTHTLTFEQRRSLVYGLSWIFGTIITPNALLPSWWLEGVAVDAETRLSAAGRLRSKMQEASIRAMVLGNSFEKSGLAQINQTDIPNWPYGRNYLYGSLLWSEMIADQNPQVIGEIHDRMGGRAPFFIEGAMKDVFKEKTQLDLFQQMQKSARAEAEKQIEILKKTPLTEGKIVDSEMMESLSPVLSPDGLKLAYVGKTEILRRRVSVLVRKNLNEHFTPAMRISNFGKDWDASEGPATLPRRHRDGDDGPPGGNINRVSWHPNSQSFVFDQLIEKNRFEEYSDLWLFDLEKGKAESLTKNARVREPSYSPTGEQIALVEIEAGVNHLALWDVTTKTRKRIYTSALQSRVSFPAWLDNDRIIFSLRENGVEKALIKNLKTDEVKEVLQGFKDPLYFDVQKDRILFTSTQNGVRNLYEANLTLDQVKPITNSGTHVFLSAYDHGAKSYIYTELTDRGMTMKFVPEAEVKTTTLSAIDPFWGPRYPPKPFVAEKTENQLTAKSEEYSALGYLWPRYWLPFVGWDSQGAVLNVSTTGMDPLGKHSYFLSGIFDSAIPNPSGVFSYTNQVYWPSYQLMGYDISQRGATTTSTSRTQLGAISAAWEIPSVSPDWFMTIGANYQKRQRSGLVSDIVGPYIGTFYSNSSQTPAQISPESGWSGIMTVGYRRNQQLERNVSTVEFSGTYFWSRWLPRRNAIMVKLNARYSDEPIQVQNLEQTTSLPSGSSAPGIAGYMMRGYQSGAFLGRNIINPIIEYRFPISRLDMGPATMPFYASRIHGAVVVDGIMFDGGIYDTRGGNTVGPYSWDLIGTPFWSAGLETRLNMNIGYHIPLGFVLGVYYPLNKRNADQNPVIGFGFTL